MNNVWYIKNSLFFKFCLYCHEQIHQLNNQSTLRPSRTVKPPGWLNDFITNAKSSASCEYPISDCLQCSHLSTSYQAYLGSFSSQSESKTFKETSQDDKWITTMTGEICALESNQTWGSCLTTRKTSYWF